MDQKVIAFNNTQREKEIQFRAGDVVKVHRKIKEGQKERIQIFEGMVIALKGGQSSSPTMTVRKVSKGGYGVEIIVAIFSPTIEKIELVKRAKVRRSKLYFIREKAAKALRFKFTDGSEVISEEFTEAAEEEVKQEVESKEVAEKEAEEAREAKVDRDTKKAEDKEKAEIEAAEEKEKEAETEEKDVAKEDVTAEKAEKKEEK